VLPGIVEATIFLCHSQSLRRWGLDSFLMPGWLDVSSPQWSSGCFGRRVLHAADGAILGAGVVLQRIQSQSGNVPAAFDKQVRFQDLLGARVVETVVDLVWLGCGNCDACAPRPYGVDIG